MPKKEKALFVQYFTDAKAKNQIEKLPNFLTEEEVFQRCGRNVYAKAIKMEGWSQQQVVKLCFGKLGIADNYLTIDSDTYFTRPFDTDILFYKGQARTYAPAIIHSNNKDKVSNKLSKDNLLDKFTKINMFFTGDSKDYNNFISGSGMWSSDIIQKLDDFIYKNNRYDFVDLINLVPLEMQWYAIFLRTQYPEKFFRLHELFAVIEHHDTEYNKKRCIPTAGYPFHYGITYQHSVDKKYINPCSPFTSENKAYVRQVRLWLKGLRAKLF